MDECLICGKYHFAQSECCPAPGAPERFARVYRRLCDEGRNHLLQAALLKYMDLFGIAAGNRQMP